MNNSIKNCVTQSKGANYDSVPIKSTIEPSETLKFIDIQGNETQKEADALIKTFVVSDRTFYQIYTTMDGFAYDPWGSYTEMEHKNRYPKLKWVTVNEKSYENYLTFLRTRNKLFLTYINRSFLNG